MEPTKQKPSVKERFPNDFPERLERFKEVAGLSWRKLALCLGVEPRRVESWRRGVVPNGGALYGLIQLSRHVRGGPEVLFPEFAEGLKTLDEGARERGD